MYYDAQIQMIVSTFKLSQMLDVDPESGRASMRYTVKCDGGARSSAYRESSAVVTIREVSRLTDNSLGSVMQQDGKLHIQIVAPRDYFTGLIHLFPQCKPDDGGYLSFNFLLNQADDKAENVAPGWMKVLNAEYKMVKQLSDNPDLIDRS